MKLSLNELKIDDNVCFVPLAWNFYNEIKNKISKYRNYNKDVLIQYFPQIKEEII